MNTNTKTKLRHPNVMTEAERLAIPDPCRPIDEAVIPAKRCLQLLAQSEQDMKISGYKSQSLSTQNLSMISTATATLTKTNQISNQFNQADITSNQPIDIKKFIQTQQRRSQHEPCKLRLSLSLLPRLVNEAGLYLLDDIMNEHPYFSILHHDKLSATTDSIVQNTPHVPLNTPLHNIETRLYLMGKMYHIMLCVFLLCQCKSRKTLNHQITLQQLTDAINAYVGVHHTELTFLTHQDDLIIESSQVEFAILAMGWQLSKNPQPNQRVTNISSQNPVTTPYI